MTNSQIETLKNECAEAGDHLGLVCCMVALGEEPGTSDEGTYLADVFAQESGRWSQETARRECELYIEYAADPAPRPVLPTTPAEAWETYVGEQSTEEFMRRSVESDPQRAAEDYVDECEDLNDIERDTVATLLARHIEDN